MNWKWINIFVRDVILMTIIMILNHRANYNSWWLAFLSGAMIVLVSWHFEECRSIQEYKRLR